MSTLQEMYGSDHTHTNDENQVVGCDACNARARRQLETLFTPDIVVLIDSATYTLLGYHPVTQLGAKEILDRGVQLLDSIGQPYEHVCFSGVTVEIRESDEAQNNE